MSVSDSFPFSPKKIVKYYKDIPSDLMKQIIAMEQRFESDDEIQPVAKKIYKYGIHENKKVSNFKRICFRLAMLEAIEPDYFLNPDSEFHHSTKCYDEKGNLVTLKKPIVIGKFYGSQDIPRVFVFEGVGSNGSDYVVKWYNSPKRDISYEIDVYRELRSLEMPLPWFSSSYKFWNKPILVMEKLHPLDKFDDEYVVGIEIIKQLFYVHAICCHNDIKPGNIMKRINKGKVSYFIIDYGGVTKEKIPGTNLYRRQTWTQKFCAQEPKKRNQATCWKYDLIELGYTMKVIQNWKTGEKEIREGFTGKLLKYMNRVKKITSDEPCKKDYIDLIQILSE